MRNLLIILLLNFTIFQAILSQPPAEHAGKSNVPGSSATIKGKVLDKETDSPVEYATVALYSRKDSSVITGTITNTEGTFEISNVRFGQYYVVIDFLGYEKFTIPEFKLSSDQKNVSLEVKLKKATLALDEVEVKANQAAYEYKIDRKVVNVAQTVAATGGTAAEALQNIPSIQTDIEGNVSLRGSSSFKVLIDGKPTVLDGNDILKTIPASLVENIEIITNPSAKYEPDGTAGIINILMKKKKSKGYSGIINASIGNGPQYGLSSNFMFTKNKLTYTIGVNYNNSGHDMTSLTEREDFLENGSKFIYTDENGLRSHGWNSINATIDYQITPKHNFSISGSTRQFSMKSSNDKLNTVWYNTVPEGETLKLYSSSENTHKLSHPGYSLAFTDVYKFDKKTELKTSFQYRSSAGNEKETLYEYLSNSSGYNLDITEKTNRETKENADMYNIDLDFTKTTDNEALIEAGYQFRGNTSNNNYNTLLYDVDIQNWYIDNSGSNNYDFSRLVHAAYGTFAKKINKLDIKLGARLEYTDRQMKHYTLDTNYVYTQFDLFPSAYFTYHLPNEQELQLNYSRRLNRPKHWHLNPLRGLSDGFTSYSGNPGLIPEFANSYELNYLKSFNQSYVSTELFYKHTLNEFDRVPMKIGDEIVRTIVNLNDEYALGGETSARILLTKFWEINPSFTYYRFWISGEFNGELTERQSYNFNTSLNTIIKLNTGTTLELYGKYRGKSVSLEGSNKAQIYTGMGVKQSMFSNKLFLTFSVRDLFNSRKHVSITDTDEYYLYSERSRQAPLFSLNVSFRLNNYQIKKQGGGEQGGDYSIDFE